MIKFKKAREMSHFERRVARFCARAWQDDQPEPVCPRTDWRGARRFFTDFHGPQKENGGYVHVLCPNDAEDSEARKLARAVFRGDGTISTLTVYRRCGRRKKAVIHFADACHAGTCALSAGMT